MRHPRRILALVTVLALVALEPPTAYAEQEQKEPQLFDSADAAVTALADAAKANDQAALVEILGTEAAPALDSGDPVANEAARTRFVESYEAKRSLDEQKDGSSILSVGEDHWPFPFPLVSSEDGWAFDVAAGMDEVLNRRIGRNETSAIQTCLAYVDAQREYFQMNPGGAKKSHFAMKLASTPGKKDGLYWAPGSGDDLSPLGKLVAEARAEGYSKGEEGERRPYHGYVYKMLFKQGPKAPGGEYDYVDGGVLEGGFGLLAFPVAYDNSGVMTFIVNQDGVVYQKDLGPDTATVAASIDSYEPSDGWDPA